MQKCRTLRKSAKSEGTLGESATNISLAPRSVKSVLMSVLIMLLVMSVLRSTAAQVSAISEDTGYLYVSREHAAWPSPESLVRDLHSKDDGVRLNALHLLGLSDERAHVKIWSQTSPSKVIDEAVVTPDQIELEYASLGDDSTQQAVLALQITQTQNTLAAVAIPKAGGWERIAVFDCWCKYEMYVGRYALAEPVQIRPAPENGSSTPQHFELVLRASGGGTGIYTQNEGHFRILHGELRRVMSFVSRRLSCDPTAGTARCDLERRWFYPTFFGNVPGGVVVEGRASFPQGTLEVGSFVRDLENRYLREATCVTYKWNAKAFQYERFNATDPCRSLTR